MTDDDGYEATADQVARALLAKRALSDSWRKKHNAPVGSYPIPDKQHARSALGFAAMHHGKGSATYQRVAAKVRAKYGVSKTWSDAARQQAALTRRQTGKSLGQTVARHPNSPLAGLAQADRSMSRPTRQANIARAKSLLQQRQTRPAYPFRAVKTWPTKGGPTPQPTGSSLPPAAKASMPPPGNKAKATFPPAKTVSGPPKDEITTGPGKPPPTPKGLGPKPPMAAKPKAAPKPPKHIPGDNGRIDKLVIGARRDALRKALGEGRSGFIRPGGPVVSDGKGQRSPRIKAGYQLPSLKIRNTSNSLGGLHNKLRTSFHGTTTMGSGESSDQLTARRTLKV
jgi:hypothetical protein